MGTSGYNSGQAGVHCFCNSQANEASDSDYTSCFGGTSSATPLTAGVAALVLSVNQGLSASAVRTILIETADKIDQAAANYQADNNGRLYSKTHGYGRVNAEKAVAQAAQAVGRRNNNSERDQVVKVLDGRTARQISLDAGKRNQTTYVLSDVWALSLTSSEREKQLLQTLDQMKLNAVTSRWATAFRSKGIVLVEGKNVPQLITKLHEMGLVNSFGRVVAFGTGEQPVVAVMSQEIIVTIADSANKQDFVDSVTEKGFTIVRQDRFDKEKYILRPNIYSVDPLEGAGR